MKIIQLMDNLHEAGGVNSFVYDLCIALKDRGHDVYLIAIIGKEEESDRQAMAVREKGIPVYCLNYASKGAALRSGIPKLRHLIEKIAGRDIVILNLHLKLSVLMGCLATKCLKNVRRAETYHSRYSHYKAQHLILRPCIRKFIPCSESAAEEMRERFKTPERKLCPIPNGIDGQALRTLAGERTGHDDIRILSVGRMTDQKNFRVSVRAFRPICGPSITYRIIGEGPDRAMLEEEAKRSPFVEFPGKTTREDTVKQTNEADIIVMPSLWEGLSIYLMEAMSLGKPLMLSNIPSFTQTMHEPELKEDEEWRRCSWGYLVRTDSEEGYREAMEDFISHPELAEAMGRASGYLSREYDIRNTAKRYEHLYLTMTHGRQK